MIHTLNAYLDAESDLYLYDDAPKGVFKEPLVRSTTDAIHQILLSSARWDDDKSKPERVKLRFTADPQACMNMQLKMDHPIVKLHHTGRDHDMSTYLVEGYFPQSFTDEMDFMDDMGGPTTVELCDHLMDYFPEAPKLFYCQVSLAEPSALPGSAPAAGPA